MAKRREHISVYAVTAHTFVRSVLAEVKHKERAGRGETYTLIAKWA